MDLQLPRYVDFVASCMNLDSNSSIMDCLSGKNNFETTRLILFHMSSIGLRSGL